MNTTYFKDLIMGNVFRTKTTPAIPSDYYLGLSTTAPTESGTNITEPSTIGTGYQRIKLTSLSEPSSGKITNTQLIAFPESEANWGLITHYVLFNSSTAGVPLMYGVFTQSRTVESDTVFTIKTGELELELINPS